ncbi:hypothetical protein [Flexibacterium corallicola]|uniref:hypothetical protein n=1 Tax=Flexibacterium corallicola TaxID=3037259 RepID=UPI00286F07C0|nr:hypothetical protein [Pseudovibrio sp. M1P-2-3]
MIIANVATYSAREGNRREALDSIACQVDVINVTLNGYKQVPSDLRTLKNANFYFPEADLKDVGKFAFRVEEHDDVFLCDDDIIYPSAYTETHMRIREEIGIDDIILGVHGVIYSDYYDGMKRSGRLVQVFHHELDCHEQVNQLGTGTVYAKGAQLPSLQFMRGSGGYVDIRFARFAFKNSYPLVCIRRQANWLQEVTNDETLYLSVTSQLPTEALVEIQDFCGLSRLESELA